MRYVIVDLEATCWEKGTSPSRMEIIEIGAVLLSSSSGQPVQEYARFVRPIMEPILSPFCTRLTSIRQQDVDSAEDFSHVFPAFLEWVGTEPCRFGSWGVYDQNQFRVDCQRHGLPFPPVLEQHINLKQAFADWKHIKPCGMKAALAMLNLPLEGQHHRGIDDARNIARIARLLLPHLEAQRAQEE